jgi:hypothetical protein
MTLSNFSPFSSYTSTVLSSAHSVTINTWHPVDHPLTPRVELSDGKSWLTQLYDLAAETPPSWLR